MTGNIFRERLSMLALSSVQGVEVALFRNMIEKAGSATAIFENLTSLSEIFPGISLRLKTLLSDSKIFERARRELDFAETHNIDVICYGDENYPYRLKECNDAPIVLYSKGNADINPRYVISIVGTRRATEYGKDMCERFVEDLSQLIPNVLVVSGLAYGIDVCAHKSAIASSLPTIGVLAHGLDRIYPAAHRNIAKSMLENGGLLTEFMSGTDSLPVNFIRRNRIVAGMSDATIVIESAASGGSLITASIAHSYLRDCFAFPGRVTDSNSAGCNALIAKNRAALITSAEDFVAAMNWMPLKNSRKKKNEQMKLFSELSSEEEFVIQKMLSSSDGVQINRLVIDTNIEINRLMSILFELEMKGLVKALAGGMYKAKNVIGDVSV